MRSILNHKQFSVVEKEGRWYFLAHLPKRQNPFFSICLLGGTIVVGLGISLLFPLLGLIVGFLAWNQRRAPQARAHKEESYSGRIGNK